RGDEPGYRPLTVSTVALVHRTPCRRRSRASAIRDQIRPAPGDNAPGVLRATVHRSTRPGSWLARGERIPKREAELFSRNAAWRRRGPASCCATTATSPTDFAAT